LDVTSPTIKGQPVSAEQESAWADEAEAGYPCLAGRGVVEVHPSALKHGIDPANSLSAASTTVPAHRGG
jgi:hypothetical protein